MQPLRAGAMPVPLERTSSASSGGSSSGGGSTTHASLPAPHMRHEGGASGVAMLLGVSPPRGVGLHAAVEGGGQQQRW
jgi:hypothetical protein